MDIKSCCFIGHRKIENQGRVKEKLTEVVEGLIKDGVTVFYFGSRSDFDKLAWKAVTEFKKKHQDIKRIYVRSAYAHISESYTKYLLESYEDTYMPEGVEKAGKAAYVERNRTMIRASDICVFYYIKGYAPPRRKNPKRALSDYQPKSGTKTAFEFAKRKRKKIINVANIPSEFVFACKTKLTSPYF